VKLPSVIMVPDYLMHW